MKRLFIILFTSLILLNCSDKSLNFEEKLSYDLDPTIIMYSRINDDVFYGKDIYVHRLTPTHLYNYTLIKAEFPNENMILKLNNPMQKGQNNIIFPSAVIAKNGNEYILSSNQEFELNLISLTDTLISAEFYGTFITRNQNDTIEVNNGTVNIHPHIEKDFLLSARMNNNQYSTSIGHEFFIRNNQRLFAIDTTYKGSFIVYFTINVNTFDTNFERSFSISDLRNQSEANLMIYSDPNYITDYNGISGSVMIEAMEDYIHEGDTLQRVSKARFDFDAVSESGELIKIRDGHFQRNGY